MDEAHTMKKTLEWFGVVTAIIYSMLVASNTVMKCLGLICFLFLHWRLACGRFFVNITGYCFYSFFTQVRALLVCGAGCKVSQNKRERLNDTPSRVCHLKS